VCSSDRVIGYSGMLVDATGLKASGIQKMPILAIHGDSDTVVPPVCLDGVQQGFEAAGFDVETVMRPHLGHGIDQFGLMRGLDFARESLEKAA
jgi:phospholipase/carboxylesterase